MKKKISIIKLLSIRAIVVFILFSIIFIGLSGYDSYLKFIDNSQNIKSNHIDNVKKKLKWEVKHYIRLINSLKERTLSDYKGRVVSRVDEAHSLATGFYNTYKKTKSDEEIKKLIIEALRAIRFENKNGYYFIIDLNGTSKLHADRPEFEGQNMLQLNNKDGVYVVKEMIDMIKENSKGFYSYCWTKPNMGKKEFMKISYIKLFKEYGWIIGTGAYQDDVETIIKNSIIDNVEGLKFDPMSNNYIFIGNWDGISQTYPAKGKNLFNIKDKNGLYPVQELIKKAKNGGGYVEYIMPNLEGLKRKMKLSYTEPIVDWEWYVGAGLYIDDINEEISALREDMYRDMKSNMVFVFSTVSMLFILFVIINRNFYKKLENDFSSIEEFLNSVARDDKKIDRELISFKEFDNIATSANNMLKKKKELDKELEYLAHHDTLTNLPNRILLQNRLEYAKENADRYHKIFAICFIDLDNLKNINDSFGHNYGDDILSQFAIKLQQNIRKLDTVARVGGDEFILLLEQLNSIEDVRMIIEKVKENLKKPFISKSKKFNVGASIGISIYPNDGDNIRELITKADDAMYEVKKKEKNNYQFYCDTFSST